VDLADISGDVYDVDFFLAGDPGTMKVTKTIVHKINGQPFYAWEQKNDGTWQRVPMKKASTGHLGVIKGSDEFEFFYRATLPQITGTGRMWLRWRPGLLQTVEIKSIKLRGSKGSCRSRKTPTKYFSSSWARRIAAKRWRSAIR
jgi:hypothetical protein